jgi:hypothetical protein
MARGLCKLVVTQQGKKQILVFKYKLFHKTRTVNSSELKCIRAMKLNSDDDDATMPRHFVEMKIKEN